MSLKAYAAIVTGLLTEVLAMIFLWVYTEIELLRLFFVAIGIALFAMLVFYFIADYKPQREQKIILKIYLKKDDEWKREVIEVKND